MHLKEGNQAILINENKVNWWGALGFPAANFEKVYLRSHMFIVGHGKDVYYSDMLCSISSYDLLCLEGLAKALRVFTGKDPIPSFRVVDIPTKSMQRMVVKPEVCCPLCTVKDEFEN